MHLTGTVRAVGKRWLIPVALAAAMATVWIGYGIVHADVPDSGVINGCYNSQNGVLHIVDVSAGQKCTQAETPISWNQAGPQGPAGPAGANGQNVTLHTPDLSNCPTGGVQLAVSGSTADVCNGAVGPAGPAGAQGLRGPQGPPGPTGPAAPRHFAEMNADGTLVVASPDVVRSSGLTGKFSNSTGSYQVDFGQVVRGLCAPVVSLHQPTGVPITPGYAMSYFTSDFQVGVITFDKNGNLANQAFDLIVMC